MHLHLFAHASWPKGLASPASARTQCMKQRCTFTESVLANNIGKPRTKACKKSPEKIARSQTTANLQIVDTLDTLLQVPTLQVLVQRWIDTVGHGTVQRHIIAGISASPTMSYVPSNTCNPKNPVHFLPTLQQLIQWTPLHHQTDASLMNN